MQCVSNLVKHAVIQCEAPEASALGAAYLAGLSIGLWPDLDAIAALPRNNKVIEPENIDSTGLLNRWNDALARSTLRTTPVKGE
jgi:glycerol kinase